MWLEGKGQKGDRQEGIVEELSGDLGRVPAIGSVGHRYDLMDSFPLSVLILSCNNIKSLHQLLLGSVLDQLLFLLSSNPMTNLGDTKTAKKWGIPIPSQKILAGQNE